MNEHDNTKPQNPHDSGPKDLIEFHLRWSEFRHLAISVRDRPDLTKAEQETICWLIILSDRIGQKDIEIK